MVFGLFKSRRWGEEAKTIYAAIVAQSRQPVFYVDLGVPDTVDGRFDMISLHAALVLRRLQAEEGKDGPAVAQRVFDTMFEDMDNSLREMGVGDLSVGKHIKGMATAFFGRAQAYEEGISAGGPGLDVALRRNLYRKAEPEPEQAQVDAVAAYVLSQAARLASQPFAEMIAGRLGFSAPVFPVSPLEGDAQ